MRFSALLFACQFLLWPAYLSAQRVGFEPVDPEKVKPWRSFAKEAYAGVYHFGAGDLASELLLFVDGRHVCGQLRQDETVLQDGQSVLRRRYRNLGKEEIRRYAFSAQELQGQFVYFETPTGQPAQGLRVDNSWSNVADAEEYEIGPLVLTAPPWEDYLPGDYPQASSQWLSRAELAPYTSATLRLMQREIEARYGQRFPEDGEWQRHFTQQDWYQPQHEDVSRYLTDFEQHNQQVIEEELKARE